MRSASPGFSNTVGNESIVSTSAPVGRGCKQCDCCLNALRCTFWQVRRSNTNQNERTGDIIGPGARLPENMASVGSQAWIWRQKNGRPELSDLQRIFFCSLRQTFHTASRLIGRRSSHDCCKSVSTLGSPEARYERTYKNNMKTATATAHTAEQSARIHHRVDFDGPTPSVRDCLPASAANAPARQRMITTTAMIPECMDSF